MSSSWTACLEPLEPSALEWLSGRFLAEASSACQAYVADNGLTEPIPDLNLRLRAQELSETIADTLNFTESPITAEILRGKLDIRVEFKSIRSVNGRTWFAAEATVSGEALQTEEKLVLDFGGPAAMTRSVESHEEGQQAQGEHSLHGAENTQSAGEYKCRQRRLVFDPAKVSRRFADWGDDPRGTHVRMTCYACVLKSLSSFPGFPEFEQAGGDTWDQDDRWSSLITRWTYDKSKRKSLDDAIESTGKTLKTKKQQALLTSQTNIRAEPQGEWVPSIDPADGKLLQKRKCKIWISDGDSPRIRRSGRAVEKEFELEVSESDIPGLLSPPLDYDKLRQPGGKPRIPE